MESDLDRIIEACLAEPEPEVKILIPANMGREKCLLTWILLALPSGALVTMWVES